MPGILALACQADVLENAKRAFDAGNYPQAAKLFAEAHQQSPRCDTLFFLGLAQYRLHQIEPALISFRSAGECDPKLIDAQLALGEAYSERGNLGEALAAFERALSIQPNHASALRGAASVYLRIQDNNQAAVMLTRLIAVDPRDPQAYADLGAASVAKGERELAQANFEAALKLQPDLPAALLGLGSLYLKNGEEQRAIPLLRKAVVLAPKAYEPRFLLGSAYNRLGKFKEAQAELMAAVRLGGEEAEIYYHLARACGGLGDAPGRAQALGRFAALSKQAKEAAGAQRQGVLLMDEAKKQVEAGNLDAALAALESARQLRPADAHVLFRLASLDFDLKRYEAARNYAQEAISLAPTEWLYHYLLGLVENAAGRSQAARASLETAVKLNPGADEARSALARLK